MADAGKAGGLKFVGGVAVGLSMALMVHLYFGMMPPAPREAMSRQVAIDAPKPIIVTDDPLPPGVSILVGAKCEAFSSEALRQIQEASTHR